MKTVACATVTCPEGIGRERVRSTWPSRSRSTMSFQVQPAPRMANAPMKNSTTCQRLGQRPALHAGEPERPPARHQQQPGADRPVEPREPQIGPRPGRREAVDPVAGRIGDAPGPAALAHSAERRAGQRVDRCRVPVLMLLASGTRRGRASRSSVGPAGARRRGGGLADRACAIRSVCACDCLHLRQHLVGHAAPDPVFGRRI